jgi:predicted permease
MLISRLFLIIFPIFAVVAIGYIYARRKSPSMDAANQINMDLFVPALIFHVLAQKTTDLAQFGSLALAAIGVMLISGLLAWPLARLFNIQWKTFVPPMMFTNCGNVGIPVCVLAFGEAALPAMVIVFVLENVLHFSLGTYLLNHRAGLGGLLRMPIIIAAIAGVTFSAADIQLPQFLAQPIEMLGQVAIPLMLFSLGVRLTQIDLADWRVGMLGAVACPVLGVIAALPLLWLFDLQGTTASVFLVFAVLPPAVLNFMVSEKFGQEPQRVASIVLLGNLFALVSIPVMLAFLL